MNLTIFTYAQRQLFKTLLSLNFEVVAIIFLLLSFSFVLMSLIEYINLQIYQRPFRLLKRHLQFFRFPLLIFPPLALTDPKEINLELYQP